MIKETDNARSRQSYAAPRLTTYGLFREMTASGSGTSTENNQGGGQPTRRP
jgi:hypothetical protein